MKIELKKIWSILSDNLEDDLDEFAQKLYEKNIITKGTRKKKDYEVMMDKFVGFMDLLKTEEEYKDHCCILLAILDGIGGAATRIGANLRESWKIAVKDKHGIADFV